ncbi:MAG: GTP 3',8-cyclase MoaA [Erysipelotrichaceae bacterium]|uniref:GTP 3',8-cyclase MoaA n=1 Tax=Floccifex sp. TaxID=2815810 RepID=UPI002A7619BF|nr:GTP 3',8-cyclase MoaA [Floccifex sp.]MDD7281364.1 GTP 3',8-cyclase MoaA [Erysipelotrichaceae bacterium]MDY2958897.1 GTP 3',8-cyclase MoaA [Floccifex sp.]
MKDQYNRNINYMRISLTDRCNYTCFYCRKDYNEHFKHEDILSYEEILNICKCAIQLGITNFKITGGEPCIRKGYIDFISQLKQLPVTSVTLTTNGSLLNHFDLDRLKEIGIDGINFSIDTLNEIEYEQICGQNKLALVLDNLYYASKIGIPCKVNCVVDEKFNEDKFKMMLSLIKEENIHLRFIEMMPMKYADANKKMELCYELLRKYEAEQVDIHLGNGPAHYYKIKGYQGYIGIIEAIHGKFCCSCNRVRLTSLGFLKLCLFHRDGLDLKPYLKDEKTLLEKMSEIIYLKPQAHNFENEHSTTIMNEVGG